VISRHRILRRGRSYGPPLPDAEALAGRDDARPRGLYFISLQASIARGFEFIQQTWLTNPGFHGLFSEPDPIMGNGDGTSPVTIPANPVRLRLEKVPSVVTVLGGGYFFLPSLAALAHIVRNAGA
jgi:deferrochelatase/peroxidase EfeB